VLEAGTSLGGYRVDGLLGQGGMGVVYEATQMSLNRRIALKVISPGLARDLPFRERFRREALAQASLDHPHVVTVHEAGEVDGHLFIAMRLVRGPSLREALDEGPMDPERALEVLEGIADALDAAHDHGVLHRDVKPSNVLVGPRDHAYLADFGLTQVAGGDQLTRSGQFVGSLAYIAPEQIRAEPAAAASDVYAFCAVLYEALTGATPFGDRPEAALLYAHLSEDPPPASERRPELPAALDHVLSRGLAKDPERRPASALEVIAQAREALGGPVPRPAVRPPEGTPTTPMPAVAPAAPRPGERTVVDRPPSPSAVRPIVPVPVWRKVLPPVAAVAAVALLVALGWALVPPGQRTVSAAPVRAVDATAQGRAWALEARALLDRVGARRAAARERLRAAQARTSQAAAASDLERALRTAAEDLSGLAGPRAARREGAGIARTLGAQADGYRAMSAAARAGDRDAFSRGASTVEAAEREQRAALVQARARGFAL
jgi:predicted Ser/Thr protein kinase